MVQEKQQYCNTGCHDKLRPSARLLLYIYIRFHQGARAGSLGITTVITQQIAAKSFKPCPHINPNKSNKAIYKPHQWLRLIYQPDCPFEIK
jgi:hypothetical protein